MLVLPPDLIAQWKDLKIVSADFLQVEMARGWVPLLLVQEDGFVELTISHDHMNYGQQKEPDRKVVQPRTNTFFMCGNKEQTLYAKLEDEHRALEREHEQVKSENAKWRLSNEKIEDADRRASAAEKQQRMAEERARDTEEKIRKLIEHFGKAAVKAVLEA